MGKQEFIRSLDRRASQTRHCTPGLPTRDAKLHKYSGANRASIRDCEHVHHDNHPIYEKYGHHQSFEPQG